MNLQVLDHVCKEKLTFRLEKKCNTRDVKEVNIVAANATIRLYPLFVHIILVPKYV